MHGQPISWPPISGSVSWPAQTKVLPYKEALTSGTRGIIFAVEMDSFDDGTGLRTDYFASEAWTTEPGDVPADRSFDGRVVGGLSLSRQIGTNAFGAFAGLVGRSIGDIELHNADGGLDDLTDRAVDGRRVTIKSGIVVEDSNGRRRLRSPSNPAAPYADFGLLVSSRGDSFSWAGSRVRLSMRDSLQEYRARLQTVVYAGTGGADGGETLTDKAKPLTWGRAFFVPATLIDAGRAIYQVHDGPISGIDAIYDRGVALDGGAVVIAGGYQALAATSAPLGGFAVAPDVGMFRLGSPAAGDILADVRGGLLTELLVDYVTWDDGTLFTDYTGWGDSTPGPGYVETAGQILLAILMRSGRFSLTDHVDWGSLEELHRTQPAPIGVHFAAGSSTTIEQALSAVAISAGAWVGPDRLGKTQAQRLAAPRSSTPVVFDERAIIDVRRLDLPYNVPPRGWTIRYRKNWGGAKRAADIAGNVPDERRADLQAEGRLATAEDASRITRHPTTTLAGPVDGLYAEQSDALAEAARLRDLYSPGRMLIEVTVKLIGLAHLGRTVRVVWGRYGLDAGRNMVVVGVREEYGAGSRAVVRLFG